MAITPYDQLRYNQVQQKSSHNSYERKEGIYDQLTYWRVRSIEFDLIRASEEGKWRVNHDILISPFGSNTYTFDAVLQVCKGFQNAVPLHEVVTVFFEIKPSGDFNKTTYTATDFDNQIDLILGAENVFKPADFLNLHSNEKPTDLADAARAGWPLLKDLRGKFIFVLNGYGRSTYCGQRGKFVKDRTCFYMNDISEESQIGSSNYIVFYNTAFTNRELGKPIFDKKFIGRVYPEFGFAGWNMDNRSDWVSVRNQNIHHLATNKINFYTDPWSSTDNDQGWPFEGLEKALDGELSEAGNVRCFGVESNDISAESDSFCFNYSDNFVNPENSYEVFVGLPQTSKSGCKCGLMARETTESNSPYFAVMRATKASNIFVQFRKVRGGETVTKTVKIAPDNTIDPANLMFMKLEISKNAKKITAFGAYFDTNDWIEIHQEEFGKRLYLQGVSCSSNASGLQRFLVGQLNQQALPFDQTEAIGNGVNLAASFDGAYPTKTEIGAVYSQPEPLSGENHRSSGDFSIQIYPKSTQFVSWYTSPSNLNKNINFTVERDREIWPDKDVGKEIKRYERTKTNSDEKLYIVNPRHAHEEFLVKAHAINFEPAKSVRKFSDYQQIAGIYANFKKLPQQTHRASGDFDVQLVPDGITALVWSVSYNEYYDSILFDVRRDISFWPDNKVFDSIGHGAITGLSNKRKLYISDPENADKKPFYVAVFALEGKPPGSRRIASVVSEAKPLSGENHRSSEDFDTDDTPKETQLMYWEVTGNSNASKIQFDVKDDRFGPDSTKLIGVKSGDFTKVYRDDDLYIANPRNAGNQDFTVRVYAIPLIYPDQ